MKVVEVAEFGSFVSFIFEDDGTRTAAQYRTEQVWRDENNVWHIGQHQQPVRVACLPGDRPEEPKLSPELARALKAAADRAE